MSGNDEITRLNNDVTTTMNLAVVSSWVLHVLTYTRKNARSVTAFNSADIRAEQDNVATHVTVMMTTVCISTDIRPATKLM